MTSQPGLQTISIHILHNISHCKGNQTMKFGPLIEYNKSNIFLQKSCRKWGSENSSKPLYFLKSSKPLYFLKKLNARWKQVACSLVSIYFDNPQIAIQRSKLYKTLGCWSRDMLNFNLHSVLPPWDQGGGNDFCVSQAGGATAKLQESGWGHIQGREDDFRQSSRGGTALSWQIVGISRKCLTLNFTNFACGAILYFSNFFIKGHY